MTSYDNTPKPVGRPPLDDKKRKVMAVRMAPDIYEWCHEYAKSTNQTFSSIVEQSMRLFKTINEK